MLQPLVVRPAARGDDPARAHGSARPAISAAYVIVVYAAGARDHGGDRRLVAGPAAPGGAAARRSRSSIVAVHLARSPRSGSASTAQGIAVLMVFGGGHHRRPARPDRRRARLGHAGATSPSRDQLGCCRSRRSTRTRSHALTADTGGLTGFALEPRAVRRRAERAGSACSLWPSLYVALLLAVADLGLPPARPLRALAERRGGSVP